MMSAVAASPAVATPTAKPDAVVAVEVAVPEEFVDAVVVAVEVI